MTGEVRYFESGADSGAITQNGFCPRCGSQLFGTTSRLPEIQTITATSLDDPSLFRPALSVFAAAAQPWDQVDPSLPSFDALPPEAAADPTAR